MNCLVPLLFLVNTVAFGFVGKIDSRRGGIIRVGWRLKGADHNAAQVRQVPALSALAGSEQAFVNLFNEAKENVAYVSSIDKAFNPLTFSVLEIPSQSGSGWVWTDREHVITNYHVVAARRAGLQSSIVNSTVLVTFIGTENQRTSYKATVVGGDASRDIALLKVIRENGTVAEESRLGNARGTVLGDSSSLQVGQRAIAIGSPFGLDHSVTSGIISGLGRRLGVKSVEGSEENSNSGNSNNLMGNAPIGSRNYDMIQTDAAINPGNSGGPLLDSSGNVIGMNTAIFSTSGAFAGVGFAIPVDTVKTVVDLLMQSDRGHLEQPKTGLQLGGGTTARALRVDRGLVVLGVESGSAAAEAGIRAMPPLSFNMFAPRPRSEKDNSSGGERSIIVGDVILTVNGKDVNTEADFLAAIAGNKVGDTVTLLVDRNVGNQEGETSRRSVTINLRLSK